MREFGEKLIGRLEEIPKEYICDWVSEDVCKKYPTCEDCKKNIVREFVNQLAEECNNGWISVKDEFPKIYENTSEVVLVCTGDGLQHMAFWCNDGKWRYCESGMIKSPMDWTEIVAWQPLPLKYESKGE